MSDRQIIRTDQLRFFREQNQMAKEAKARQAPTAYAIWWKRKDGIYEPGAKGPT